MLKRLRIQLTILYILAALGLVAMISMGANLLLRYYFQRQTDLALNYKMAIAFQQYNLPLPTELQQAEKDYLRNVSQQSLQILKTQTVRVQSEHQGGDEEDKGENRPVTAHSIETEGGEYERYDAELAPIYVLPIDAQGNLLTISAAVNPPLSINQEAKQAALNNGSDLRTARVESGEISRLLTYRIDKPGGPVFLQVGRSLADQVRIQNQFLLGLLGLGFFAIILLGLGSWWLSGQTLIPAQKSWDQQVNFISNASHELRTPLTLIRASAEVIKRSQPLVQEQNQLIDDVLSECDYMDRLVTDLLLLSRLDTSRLQLTCEPVSLPELLHEITQSSKNLVGSKHIDVKIARAEGIVMADPGRLRQVLLILIDNAIRYTPDGGIIQLEAYPQSRSCQIVVADNGAGIAPEHLPHIFDRFYQANPIGEGSARSNGLGLSIAKGIIIAMGGKINIYSEPGLGTRATIELPVTIAFSDGRGKTDQNKPMPTEH
jgi:signal transduction histidine kinase